MELLHARSVTEIVREQGSLIPERTAAIGAAVAAALTAAHTVGTTHRDVKPANVLIGTHDHRVTLTDFGLARNSDEQTMTGAGLILGSPAYIGPETAKDNPSARPPTPGAWAPCCSTASKADHHSTSAPRSPPSPRWSKTPSHPTHNPAPSAR